MTRTRVVAGRIEGLTGVWVDPEAGVKARKICAFGVKCRYHHADWY